jgi:hypothetical protein
MEAQFKFLKKENVGSKEYLHIANFGETKTLEFIKFLNSTAWV